MVMAVLTVIPRTNVSAADIRDTLNNYGGSCTNDIKTFFTNGAINPGNKYKPVPLAVDFCQDFDSSAANYYANWWKGNDGFCGYNIPTTSVGATVDGVWSYNPPSGGTSEPFRLGDFRGYRPQAYTDMFGDFDLSSIYVNGMYGATANYTWYPPNDEFLVYADIFSDLRLSLVGRSYTATKSVTSSGSVEFTSTELALIGQGNSPGEKIKAHFYGAIGDTLYSLRNTNATRVIWDVIIRTMDPYVPKLSVGSITLTTDYVVIKNLVATLDATYAEGGTLAKDNSIVIYEYQGDDYDFKTNPNNAQPIWNTMLNAITVEKDASVDTTVISDSTLYTQIPEQDLSNGITVLWFDYADSAWNIIAKLHYT